MQAARTYEGPKVVYWRYGDSGEMWGAKVDGYGHRVGGGKTQVDALECLVLVLHEYGQGERVECEDTEECCGSGAG